MFSFKYLIQLRLIKRRRKKKEKKEYGDKISTVGGGLGGGVGVWGVPSACGSIDLKHMGASGQKAHGVGQPHQWTFAVVVHAAVAFPSVMHHPRSGYGFFSLMASFIFISAVNGETLISFTSRLGKRLYHMSTISWPHAAWLSQVMMTMFSVPW